MKQVEKKRPSSHEEQIRNNLLQLKNSNQKNYSSRGDPNK